MRFNHYQAENFRPSQTDPGINQDYIASIISERGYLLSNRSAELMDCLEDSGNQVGLWNGTYHVPGTLVDGCLWYTTDMMPVCQLGEFGCFDHLG